jgi:hypothetical protein
MGKTDPQTTSELARHITILVPGLFAMTASGPSVRMQPPLLKRLLARADTSPQTISGFEMRLFHMCGGKREPNSDLPVAAVTRVADMGVVDNDWWVRADPVYLEPHRDRLVLHAGLDLTVSDAERLAEELNESLAVDGWLLKAPHPERWYMKPDGETAITTTPLSEAMGHDIHPLLPRGADQRTWHTRLNELQILLHTSPVNVQREAQGRRPANSVWFWGGGRLPRLQAVNWDAIWANDPLSLGLARLAAIPVHPLPQGAGESLRKACRGNDLVVLGDIGLAPDALKILTDSWLNPLLKAVHAGEMSSLTLISDTGPVFRYSRRCRWRLWRRLRPLESWREAA